MGMYNEESGYTVRSWHSLKTDIDELLRDSNPTFRENYLMWLEQRKVFLEDNSYNCHIMWPNDYEPMKGYDNLFAITYRKNTKHNKNIRILYTIDKYEKLIVLLNCFLEEKGRADYRNAIKTAIARKKIVFK